jgi:class 3 adenylate cyclase
LLLSGIGGDESLLEKYRALGKKHEALEDNYNQQAKELTTERAEKELTREQLAQLLATADELQATARLQSLKDRVCVAAYRLLLESQNFREKFLPGKECTAFVMSVDIRRSTDLMLKAHSPEAFAQFTTDLCIELRSIIVDALGVFDKFTGDGVLAFFPDFYSGPDSAYHVTLAAHQCHEAFRNRYEKSRRSFSSVLKDVGLGIGIDYGKVHLAQIAGDLTVVGRPVVFACRLSGAPPLTTLLNQPAFEVISDGYSDHCDLTETDFDIKHEGKTVAYQLTMNSAAFSPRPPEWMPKANG